MNRLLQAILFAAAKHANQRRDDPAQTPYINHPIEVASILSREGGVTDEVVLIAAILHDTIEDTETTAAELVAHFGQDIADVVLEVTDDTSLPKAVRKQRQIQKAPHISPRAQLVKVADKTANLRDMAKARPIGWTLARTQDYFDWAKAVVDGVRGVHPALEKQFDAIYAQKP